MNKKNALIALLACFALSSCADTSELYEGNAYVSLVFKENCYSVWSPKLLEARIQEKKTLANFHSDGSTEGCYFAGSDLNGNLCSGYGQLAERHPDAIKNGDSTLYWTVPAGGVSLSDGTFVPGGLDIINNGVGVWTDPSGLEEILYGQNKKLSRANSGFSKGYLSKLYNGQIQCDAWSSYSLVELDKRGYGTLFPAELHSAPYFAFSCRGGSDTPSGTGRLSRFEIDVTFYKMESDGYVGTTFTLDQVPLETNISAEDTSLVGFYFDEVGYDPSGILGMSMTFSIQQDEVQIAGETYRPSDDFTEESDYYTALMLLEVMFPDSEWN